MTDAPIYPPSHKTYRHGDRVRKKLGAEWHGRVCGVYRTALTPEGYCVESEREPGSVQIYPGHALEMVEPAGKEKTDG